MATIAGAAVFTAGWVFAGASGLAFTAAEHVVDARMVQQSEVPIELAANPQKSYSKKWGHGKKPGRPKRR
jgi:hypothetical protein